MKTMIAVLAVAGLTAVGAQAYQLENVKLPEGIVPFYLNLGGTYNDVARTELAQWDQYTGQTHLRATTNPHTNGGEWYVDGRNSIEWSSAIGWNLPDNYLGVFSTFYTNVHQGVMSECDIFLNEEYAAEFESGYYNIGRVLLHEIGHAIGLDHSSAYGAVMGQYIYAYTPDILTADDIAGARAIYGPRIDGGGGNVPDTGSTAALLFLAFGVLALRQAQEKVRR